MANGRFVRLVCVLFLVAGAVVIPADPAVSAEPDTYEGNLSCEQVNPEWDTVHKAALDARSPAAGSHGSLQWSVTESDDGQLASWSSTEPISAVLVKGGNIGGSLYHYDPATFEDSGLHTPANRNGGLSAIRHMTFCAEPPDPLETGHVIISKITDPTDSDQAFDFTSSIDGFAPQLTDGEEAHVEVDPGEYTVTEASVAGWALVDITCDAAATVNLDSRSVTFGVAEGATVRCNFTDAEEAPLEPALLTLKKVTDPVDEDATFRFFTSVDGWTPVLGHDETSTIEVDPGTYTLTENSEHAWTLSSIVCQGGDAQVDLAAGTATVTVAEGEHATCTFTNTLYCPKHGYIAVEKYTDPVDESVPFAFTSDAVSRDGDPFLPVLHHGESDYVIVDPGTYSITELPVDGWTLADLSCDDPDAVIDVATATATVTISPSELATCVFTNTPVQPEPGKLVVAKVTEPEGADADFAFTSTVPGFEPVLSDGESASVEVAEGTYTVTEVLTDGWELTDISCDDPGAMIDPATGAATVFVPAGNTVTCTYTNEAVPIPPARLTVRKVTEPAGAEQGFMFTVLMGDGSLFDGELHDGESVTLEIVTPDSVFNTKWVEVGEHWVDGWNVSDITCDSDLAEINLANGYAYLPLDPGETVTCTFTNTQEPEPLGSIGDFVWDDRNRNGIQDAGEPGISGVRLNLYAAPAQGASDGLERLATTRTDSNGKYLFDDLPAGHYIVEFTDVPAGYRFTTPFAAARTIDSDADKVDGRSPVMTLTAGLHDMTCDAGLYALGDVLAETGAELRLPFVTGSVFLAVGLVLLAVARPRRRTARSS